MAVQLENKGWTSLSVRLKSASFQRGHDVGKSQVRVRQIFNSWSGLLYNLTKTDFQIQIKKI